MMKRVILLTLLAFVWGVQVQAQSVVDSAAIVAFGQHLIDKSTFIFEGEVVATTPYYRQDGQYIYTENRISINRIFKGQGVLSCGDVNLITEGGLIGDDHLGGSHNLTFGEGMVGVFFCDSNTYDYTLTNTTGNPIVKSLYSAPEALISYYNTALNPAAYGIHTQFSSILDVYNYIDSIDTIQLPPHDICFAPFIGPEAGGHQLHNHRDASVAKQKYTPEQVKQRLAEQRQKGLAHQHWLQERSQFASRQKRSAMFSDLEITTANDHYIHQNGTDFFEFEIYVSSSTFGTFLDNVAFRLDYNDGAFGQNIMASGGLQFTPGPEFNNATYVNPSANAFDDLPNRVGFGMGINTTPPTRTEVTSTPKLLMTIRLQITNCQVNQGIDFAEQVFLQAFAFYTTNATEPILGSYFVYDQLLWPLQGFDYFACVPYVDNVLAPVYGGIEDVLVIEGHNFCNSRGLGRVSFRNAENGGQTFIEHLDASDYLSWTDKQIKIRVPSKVDTLPLPGMRQIPGSGQFVVRNKADYIASSDDGGPFVIPYSVANVGTLFKRRVDIADQNGFGGITFTLDTSISNNPIMEALVRKAVREWVCKTNLNLRVAANDTALAPGTDGVNLITLDNSYTGFPLAQTMLNTRGCVDAGGTAVYFADDIDLRISRTLVSLPGNVIWFLDSTGADKPAGTYDFFGVVLHELGHAVGLNHVNQPSDLMYHETTAQFLSGTDRLTIKSNDRDGGVDVRAHSTFGQSYPLSNCNPNFLFPITAAPAHQVLILPGCTLANDVEVPEHFDLSMRLFPNPVTSQDVVVEFELGQGSNVEVSVTNLLGQVVYSAGTSTFYQAGVSQIVIPGSRLAAGVNFITLYTDKNKITGKVIKQ